MEKHISSQESLGKKGWCDY